MIWCVPVLFSCVLVLVAQVFSPKVVEGAESIADSYEEDDDGASSVVESFSQVGHPRHLIRSQSVSLTYRQYYRLPASFMFRAF